MTQVLFSTSALLIRTASKDDVALLSAFCEDNPGYDIFLTGEVPETGAWVEDFLTDLPPAEFNWTATHKLIAFRQSDPSVILAIMDVTEDMLAKSVGHIGLFQVAESAHGTGLAHELYRGLESWFESRGTCVIRLGVFNGNTRGMAFWTRHGYVETRQRVGTAPTGKSHLSHVMYKPLVPMSLTEYRALVPRDDPNSH